MAILTINSLFRRIFVFCVPVDPLDSCIIPIVVPTEATLTIRLFEHKARSRVDISRLMTQHILAIVGATDTDLVLLLASEALPILTVRLHFLIVSSTY